MPSSSQWVAFLVASFLFIQVPGPSLLFMLGRALTGRALATGFVVGLTNPKTIVFFVAFLLQFTSTTAPAGPQLAVLGLVFGAMAITSDSVWAVLAGRARSWFARRPERLDTLGATGGVLMIGLGTTMAVTE